MSTTIKENIISSTLFGKTRRAVLSLLFTHIDESFYLREISRTTGAGIGAVQREIEQLYRSGIIRRAGRGRSIYYQANPDCPVFDELKSLVVKTAGVGDVLRAAFTPLADHIKKSAGIKKMKRKNNGESEN
jgi:DNA-binding transcriptional ArsR family regulator